MYLRMNICAGEKRVQSTFPMPNHRLCQLGEFMLYDFHQQKKVAVTEHFHNSSRCSYKELAQQSSFS